MRPFTSFLFIYPFERKIREQIYRPRISLGEEESFGKLFCHDFEDEMILCLLNRKAEELFVIANSEVRTHAKQTESNYSEMMPLWLG